MRRLVPVATVLAALALLVWAFLPRPLAVETAPVARRDLTVSIDAEGEARIREVVVVSAPTTGLLQRITLHAGDSVTAGQTVARIGPVVPALLDSRARAVAGAGVAAATAAVELAQSQLLQSEATLDFARIEATRARALFARAASSQHLLDNAILAERTAQAAVASARANLAMRGKELQSARAVLDGGTAAADNPCCVEVKGPAAGRILRVVTEDEQVVQAGTPLIEIGDTADLEIVADVLSRDAVAIRPKAAAIIIGWGGADLAARVDRIEPGATTRISALGIEEQRVGVRLALLGPAPPSLGHGFRVTAAITVWQGRDVLTVPVAALFREGADWAVYTAQDGRAGLRHVTLGARNADYAQVLDGLTEADTVILHPADDVQQGIRISRQPTQAPD